MSDIQRVLISGGCGFVGANLVRFVRERTSWDVRVIDDLRKGKLEHLGEGMAEVVVGDVADTAVLEPALEGVDAVIHLASETGVVPSVEDPVKDFEGNPVPTFRALEACRRLGIERFVYASSGSVLGDVAPPAHEELVPKPLSPYGAGKLVGEAYCRAFAASYGMRTASLRFANVYGPWSLHKRGNAVPGFIRRCLAGEAITIFGDGTQTRDFIHVDDLSEAIRRAAVTEGISGEVFHISTNVETSIIDLAELVKKVLESDVEIRFEPARPGEVYRNRADNAKARRVLGFDPQVSLEDGIRRTADWYREHWRPD